MVETEDRIGYEEWDNQGFIIPDRFHLDEKSKLHEAIEVFYMAGGYDFFEVVNPEKYALNWLIFMGNLYSDIEDGSFKTDGKHHSNPLTEEQRIILLEQGVPPVFVNDIE